MRTLTRFALRELLASKWKFAVLALILASQTAALAGGSVAFDSLFYTRDHYYDALRFADLQVQIRAATADEISRLAELRNIAGIRGVSRRFNSVAYAEIGPQHRQLPVVVHYVDPHGHPAVNDIAILEGTYLQPDDPNGAVIERSFAAAHGLSVGDKFVVDPHNFPAEFRVVGIGLSPEYLMPTANPDMLIPNRGSLGVVFASSRKLSEMFVEPLYNEVSFRFEPGADPEKTSHAVIAALSALHIERAMPRSSNFGFRYVENILGGSRIFMPMTAALLAAMAAIVAIVLVSRLVGDRRREIGALMAQGFSAPELVAALMLLGLIPAALGGLAGVPSAMLFAKSLAVTNASIAGLPDPMMIYPAARLVSAVGVALLVGVSSVLVASIVVLRGGPARMLRSDGGMARAPQLPAAWLAALSSSVTFRYAVRNLWRRVALSAAAVGLVALAIAMPAGMLTAMSSWDIWARETSAQLPWDAGVSFKSPLTEAEARSTLATAGIRTIEPWLQGYATLERANAAAEEMRVVGTPVPSKLQPFQLAQGRGFENGNAGEIIVNTSFLRGAEPPALGELVTLRFDGRTERLTVVGWQSDASIATVFIPLGTAQRLFDQPGQYSAAYVAFDAPSVPSAGSPNALPVERVKQLEAELLTRESVGSVQLKLDVTEAMIVYLHGFNAVVVPFIFLAGVLGFLFLGGVLSLVIAERAVEYATLRSLGYAAKEVSRIVLTELAVLVMLGLGASVFFWFQLAVALRDLMARAWFWIPVSLRAADYAVVSVPVVVFVAAAAVPAIWHLLRSDLSFILRERALG